MNLLFITIWVNFLVNFYLLFLWLLFSFSVVVFVFFFFFFLPRSIFSGNWSVESASSVLTLSLCVHCVSAQRQFILGFRLCSLASSLHLRQQLEFSFPFIFFLKCKLSSAKGKKSWHQSALASAKSACWLKSLSAAAAADAAHRSVSTNDPTKDGWWPKVADHRVFLEIDCPP